jgi:hypothetical protein
MNEYVRLKTRAGNGKGAKGETGCDEPCVKLKALNQGIEMRDGEKLCGTGQTWTEINDADDRGLWFSHDNEFSVWRARLKDFEGKPARDMHIGMSDKGKFIIIWNNEEGGKVQIWCAQDVEIKSDRHIKLDAKDSVYIKAGKKFCVEAGGAHLLLAPNVLGTDVDFNAPRSNAIHTGCAPGGDAGPKSPVSCVPPSVAPRFISPVAPSDRAEVKNEPFDKEKEEVLEKPDDDDAGEKGKPGE